MPSHSPIPGFFAYPSQPPTVSETITDAVTRINEAGTVNIRRWEDCSVNGQYIISVICEAIDHSDFVCADLTGLNPNVLYEVGYAIGKQKRLWLVTDTSYTETKKDFEATRILTTLGYVNYQNYDHLIGAFHTDHPHYSLDKTIFSQEIAPGLTGSGESIILHLKDRYDTTASIRLTDRFARSPIKVITDDPSESGVQTLAWYGQMIYKAEAVLCELTKPDRDGARAHNAKYSLVAGIAAGMGKPFMMVIEGATLGPIDYRDILFNYSTAAEVYDRVDKWLLPIEADWQAQQSSRQRYATAIELSAELQTLNLGEHIAENEADELVALYFIPTSAYRDALAGSSSLFVGRKGTGKSANLLKLEAQLRLDKRNLVCVVKPLAYELQGIVKLLAHYREVDQRSHAIEALWKYLLYTEIANSAAKVIENRPAQTWTNEERALLDLLDRDDRLYRAEFAVRLERSVERILEVQSSMAPDKASSVEYTRKSIAAALHENVINNLRQMLGEVLRGYQRIAILIDNLDKAWDRQADLAQLSHFILGLLSLSDRLTIDLRGAFGRKDAPNVTVTIFLRSDIFRTVQFAAREPDKLLASRIQWDDRDLLIRVIEERFISQRNGAAEPNELWDRFFCANVNGRPVRDYILDRILPRPRDLVYFVKNAVDVAVNRRHTRVEEDDIYHAEKIYSEFVLQTALVETTEINEPVEDFIYELVGSQHIISGAELETAMTNVGVSASGRDDFLNKLFELSLLGLETSSDYFAFTDDPKELRRNLALARRFNPIADDRRYRIHSAFWSSLAVTLQPGSSAS